MPLSVLLNFDFDIVHGSAHGAHVVRHIFSYLAIYFNCVAFPVIALSDRLIFSA